MRKNVAIVLFGSIFLTFYVFVESGLIDDLDVAEEKCRVKYPTITIEVMDELKVTRDIAKFQASHTELNCFMTCMGQELKLIDQDGNLHFENIKEFTMALTSATMVQSEAHAAVSHCMKVSEHDDMCERVGKYAVCKIEKLKEHSLVYDKD